MSEERWRQRLLRIGDWLYQPPAWRRSVIGVLLIFSLSFHLLFVLTGAYLLGWWLWSGLRQQ